MVVWLILSAFALVVGTLTLTGATAGVGGIAIACAFAIFGRIAQSGQQHKELMRAQRAIAGQPEPLRPEQIKCGACGVVATRGPSHCQACGVTY